MYVRSMNVFSYVCYITNKFHFSDCKKYEKSRRKKVVVFIGAHNKQEKNLCSCPKAVAENEQLLSSPSEQPRCP